MSHFRKVQVDGKVYEYKVGRHGTWGRGIAYFTNSIIGYCHDVSMDKFSVSPRAVRIAIRKHLRGIEMRETPKGTI